MLIGVSEWHVDVIDVEAETSRARVKTCASHQYRNSPADGGMALCARRKLRVKKWKLSLFQMCQDDCRNNSVCLTCKLTVHNVHFIKHLANFSVLHVYF
uniref:Uncharacterized protein n=1 Tax=Anguilla anguilla TaxID=7936 RepID=A0A0E9Q0B6_ANGAN